MSAGQQVDELNESLDRIRVKVLQKRHVSNSRGRNKRSIVSETRRIEEPAQRPHPMNFDSLKKRNAVDFTIQGRQKETHTPSTNYRTVSGQG